jgi:hypothetical protein
MSEAGLFLGRREKRLKSGDLATLEQAILGLLALMIGFTFLMALSRFDARRDAILGESNAIGTVALRARLLPVPFNEEALKLLREYAQVRLSATQNIVVQDKYKAAIDRASDLREALWRTTSRLAAKESGIVPTGIFVQALNEMIDSQGRYMFALQSRVPNVVFWALYGVTVVAFFLVGYASGLSGRRLRLPVYLMAVVVSGLIMLIQDLDRPTIGFITVTQQPMIDVVQSIGGYIE